MIQETELVQLVMAVVMTPIVVISLRGFRAPSRPYVLTAMSALLLSYIFTVAEIFWAPDLMNFLEHVSLALASISFAMSAWVTRKHWYDDIGSDR